MPFAGELVALGTVLCWTLSVQFFAAAAKEIGSTPVNIIRLFIALILFVVFLWVRDGTPIPLGLSSHAWIFLSLSGVIGFYFGDIFLFKALVELGPRVAMLIQSLAAPTAALLGWLFLDETYRAYQWFGMAVALLGVMTVISEKGKVIFQENSPNRRAVSLSGVLYGCLGMSGQAGGVILSKIGMQADGYLIDAFAATEIRAIAAFFCFVSFFTITRRWTRVREAIKNKKAVICTGLGAIFGPFLGVSLSLLALHYLSSGIASTFFALVPITLIPFAIFLHKEHVSLRAILGAITAVAGVCLLSVRL